MGTLQWLQGLLYGELDVNDDEDWFSMTLNANEGVTLQIAYNTTYTSSNGINLYQRLRVVDL